MSDYNNFDGLNNRENETENLSEEKNEYKPSESENTYSADELSADEILKDVEFAEEKTASTDDSKVTDPVDEYKTTDYSASGSYSNTNSYTTTSGNNGGTASYEWNNGQYSGKYTAELI